MLIVLDNAESILDPQGAEGQEIYRVVEELSQFPNICLVVTSRITATPPNCETLDIPTLSMEAASATFYSIYKHKGHPDLVDDLLKQLDFHPLSIALLATVAHQNKWDGKRLTKEWERRRTSVLRTEQNESLAATIEFSLSSPMFKQLGPNARDLLGVVAFFPQGLNEDNLGWLFPTISNVAAILDKFCVLSLAYRCDGFLMMLAPLRDYLSPKDPLSSPLFRATTGSYFALLAAELNPNLPEFRETQWITSEDANVEFLLNTLTTIDASLDGVWSACADFLRLLYWHKPRQTMLGPKIESLPDSHHSKPQCLFMLARSFESIGNHAERKRLLDHALNLGRKGEDYDWIALTLTELSDANRMLGLREEGIPQVREALEIYELTRDAVRRGESLLDLASLSYDDNRLDDAEEAASQALEVLPESGQEFRVCRAHRVIGNVYRSMGEREVAIYHLEMALGIASPFNWNHQLFWIHHALAILHRDEDEFDDANAHVEQAQSHAVNNSYNLGCAFLLRAQIYHRQRRPEDSTSEVLRALEIFQKLGAPRDLEVCGGLLRDIGRVSKSQATHSVSGSSGEAPGNNGRFHALSTSPGSS